MSDFSSQTSQEDNYNGYKLLAVGGSDIQIPTNLNDEDAIVFKRKEAFENKALVEMVERSIIKGKVIVIMDRGYEA